MLTRLSGLGAAAAVVIAASGTVVAAAPALADGAHTLFVTTSGVNSSSCGPAQHPCRTITRAVRNAHAGDRIVVLRGTYRDQVTLTKRLTLVGHDAVIDGTNHDNGVLITGNASGSVVTGFRITGATGEGILAVLVGDLRITHNRVTGNDKGFGGTAYAQCAPQGEIPGDCGEGLHLMSVWSSWVAENSVDHNVGGILVTDEVGPNHGNTVARNNVYDNREDCGITMPSHNGNALSATGARQPDMGGVYGNLVVGNRVSHNGGSGVLIAAPFPGTASYENSIVGNTIVGNGNAGITIHSHAPNQDVNGTRMIGNNIGTNNLMGDPDPGDMQTTGIIVFSAVVPVNGTVIERNLVHDNHFGIWLQTAGGTASVHRNVFHDVDVPVTMH